jgi:hypothetical protein
MILQGIKEDINSYKKRLDIATGKRNIITRLRYF